MPKIELSFEKLDKHSCIVTLYVPIDSNVSFDILEGAAKALWKKIERVEDSFEKEALAFDANGVNFDNIQNESMDYGGDVFLDVREDALKMTESFELDVDDSDSPVEIDEVWSEVLNREG